MALASDPLAPSPSRALPQAVCALILREGLALCVSRRRAPDQWGLVGGKVDEGETPMKAVIRETFEETGFLMRPEDLRELFSAVCHGPQSFDVITYLHSGAVPDLGALRAEEGLCLAFKPLEQMRDPAISPFASYNEGVVLALGRV